MKNYSNLLPNNFLVACQQDKQGILLDVRTQEEFEALHLPNAINIDIKKIDFTELISELDKQKNYYIYCQIGLRSANACNYMARQGFNTYNLQGGLRALSSGN